MERVAKRKWIVLKVVWDRPSNMVLSFLEKKRICEGTLAWIVFRSMQEPATGVGKLPQSEPAGGLPHKMFDHSWLVLGNKHFVHLLLGLYLLLPESKPNKLIRVNIPNLA